MEVKAKLFGHPIHQTLIVFPLGLLATALIFDLIYIASSNGKWSEIAYWMMTAGIVGGLISAPFGFLDWLTIPKRTRARAIGALHGLGNVVVLILFFASWLIHHRQPTDPGVVSFVLSLLGLALVVVTGWLGGELVDRMGIGVSEGAHADAPSSLTHQSTRGLAPESRGTHAA